MDVPPSAPGPPAAPGSAAPVPPAEAGGAAALPPGVVPQIITTSIDSPCQEGTPPQQQQHQQQQYQQPQYQPQQQQQQQQQFRIIDNPVQQPTPPQIPPPTVQQVPRGQWQQWQQTPPVQKRQMDSSMVVPVMEAQHQQPQSGIQGPGIGHSNGSSSNPYGSSSAASHPDWGSGQVVETEVRYAGRSGQVQMKKVRSMDKILKHARNGGGGGRSSGYEREPLLSTSANGGGGAGPGGGGGGGGHPATERGQISGIVIGAEEIPSDGVGLCGLLLTGISWLLVIVTLPFSLCVCFKVVQEYERAVIFRLGRLLSGGSRGPGIFFVLPCIESYQKVDLRTITLGVPPQEVLTKDSVTVSVDAVVYYRVSNATVSVANVENAHHSTRLLAQTTLRNILGTKNLHEILSDRESISGSMQAALDEATEPWGIKVERVEIKDVRLPVQLQRAMAAEAEAAREARAKVIAAEGEQKASRALREASEVIADTPSALQLRYLQTLNTISAEKNSTIVFPLPIDILSHLLKPKEE